MLIYKIIFSKKAKRDLLKISKFMKNYNSNKIIEKIYNDISYLEYMPRIHKTLIYFKDKNGEYRRMISGKYSIIYKIAKDEVIILRIFNQKENYLNTKRFILKEKSEKYIINERRNNRMLKIKTLKNSYAKLKENYTHIITEEEAQERYFSKLLDEAIRSFEKNPVTISLEEWHEHMRREYNIAL